MTIKQQEEYRGNGKGLESKKRENNTRNRRWQGVGNGKGNRIAIKGKRSSRGI